LGDFGFSLEPVREEQKGMQRASASYTFGRFQLDAAERRLSRDGQPIPLTPKAFDTLLTLVRHSGHALTKDELMRAVWPDGFVEEINLASNISILRKALADGQLGEAYIETVPKLGYRFIAPVQTKGASQAQATADSTFGDLLSQHLHRRHGLSQSKLAAGILQSPAVITAMCKGKRLTGPQARERVLTIIGWLRQQGALETVDEANALLSAAGMASLRQGMRGESALIQQLHAHPSAAIPPPAITPAVRRTNLPAQLTRFIGREQELAEVADALRSRRLVSVIGVAGMGKTRLAQQVGESVLNQFADGVWLVELAPLADEALVPTAVASVLGLSEQPGRSLVDALSAFIGDKHMLVILDNCEHLIEACARLAEALLRACPKLCILTTSREALRLPGEVIWRIPPLSTPDPDDLPSLDDASDFDAVQLFIEHTTLAQPDFAAAPDDLATIVRICQQLDGMPLAIEMAAALVPFLGLAGVSTGLDNRLALLTNNNRTAIPHHQTLRATLDWSYNLLTEPERALLARLSVFAGGWTAEAAHVVCESTHHALLQLVRHSLVIVVHEQGGQPRYRLLETIRHYAGERLRKRGDREATLDHHLAYFLDMAEEPVEMAGPRVDPWVQRMEADLDNVRAAFAWAMSREREGDNESALRLVWAMTSYGFHRGHWTEIGVWTNQAWSRADNASANARALGLLAKASCFLMTGDKVPGVQLCEQALPLLREADDRVNLVHCLEMIANNATDARAQAYAEELFPLAREFGSDDMQGRAFRALGTAALRAGDCAKAVVLLEQAIEFAPWDGTVSYWYLYHADPKRALALCAQKFAELTPSAVPGNTATMLLAYGIMLASEGDYAGARRILERCIRASEQMGPGRHIDLALMEMPLPLHSSELSARGVGIGIDCHGFVFLMLGLAERILGRFDYALARIEQGYTFANEAGMVWLEVVADFLKTSMKIDAGHLDGAMPKSVTCLQRLHEVDQHLGPVMGIAHIAGLLGRRGDLTRASILFGAVEALIPKLNFLGFFYFCIPLLWLQHAQGTIIAPTIIAARAALGDAEFEAAYAEGQRMTLEQAVEYALSETN
jgi:predicted ATPase/DNA-binding winged helix-turn-helix (wHTH) protein